jgi:Ca2+:H+ antiporter
MTDTDAGSHPSPSVAANRNVPKNELGALRDLVELPLYWLVLAVPVAAVLKYGLHLEGPWVFIASGLAIVPLAGVMGRATESLAETMGAGVGGLLNATFGNAAELIIGVMVLLQGERMYPLVKASITGSIIGNILLVLGLAILVGGFRHSIQCFNRTAASTGSALLWLATIGLVMPTVYYHVLSAGRQPNAVEQRNIESLSEEIAGILAMIYVLSLIFSLWTHRHLFAGEESESLVQPSPEWSRRASVVLLLGATCLVAWMSELLVASVESAAHSLGMNQVFIGVIVVAVVGNAAEHSTAVLMAMKNKMDIAVHIAIGSGLQIALFVAPVLVFLSMFLGNHQPLDLHFTILEMISLILAVLAVALVAQDGETHWMEGAMLLGVYVIMALAFYHLPGAEIHAEPR